MQSTPSIRSITTTRLGWPLVIIMLSSCGTTDTSPDDASPDGGLTVDEIRPALIWHPDIPDDPFAVPCLAWVGVPLVMTIHTIGTDCERVESTEVYVSSDEVTIRPLDRTYIPAGHECMNMSRRLEHTFTINFESPGEHVFQLIGRGVGIWGDRTQRYWGRTLVADPNARMQPAPEHIGNCVNGRRTNLIDHGR